MVKQPKDYLLAERAYGTFYNEQPQTWFENLSHDYQMRWVHAIRTVRDALKRKPGRKPKKATRAKKGTAE